MPISDNEELGVNLHARPFSDSVTGVPIKKRRFMLEQTPSPQSHIPSSPPTDRDVPQKSSELESSISDIGNQPSPGTAFMSKDSYESKVESIGSTGLNNAPDHGILRLFDHQGMRLNLAGKGTINLKDMAGKGTINLKELLPAMGSSELPVKEGSGERNFIPSDTSPVDRVSRSREFQLEFKEPCGLPEGGRNPEGCSVKQDKFDCCSWDLALGERQQYLQSKCSDVTSKVDSSYMCLNRSNWDLNTMMDTWEGSSRDLSLNNGTDSHDTSDLRGIHNKRLDSGTVQNIYKEPDIADATLDSSNLSTSMGKGNNAEAYLNLQLKPSFSAESFFKWGSTCPSGKLDSNNNEMPPLSLSMMPSSSCNLAWADCRAVKAETREEGISKDTRKTEVGGTVSAGLKHVKCEPCEVQESPKGPCQERCQKSGKTELGGTGSAGLKHIKFEPREVQDSSRRVDSVVLKSACRVAVKSEPLEVQSQGHFRKLSDCCLAPQSTGKIPDVSEHVDKDLQMSKSNVTQSPGQTVDKTRELDTQLPIHSNEMRHVSSGTPQWGKGIASESSGLVEKTLVSEAKELNLVTEAHKMPGVASELPSESLLSDDKEHMVADGNSEVVAQLSCAEGLNLSIVASADELDVDSYGKGDATESSKVKIELSAEVLDNPCDREKESNGSQTVGVVASVHKPFGHDGYEDGEVRDPAVHNTIVSSCKRGEEKPVEDADSIHPVEIPVEETSHVNSKDDKTENSAELKIHSSVNSDGVQCSNKNDSGVSTTPISHGSLADGLPNAGSGKRKLRKTIRSIPRDHLKDKGPYRKPKSERALNATTVLEGSHGEQSNQQENAGGSDPLLAKAYVSSKTELPLKDDAKKPCNDRSNTTRIIYLNPSPNGLASEKTKSIPDRSLSSRIDRKRFISLKRDKFRSRRVRGERWNQRSRVFESEGKDQPVGRQVSSMMHVRSRAHNQLNALHGDRNSDHEHLLEQADGSTSARFPRPMNASEVAVATATDGYIGNAGRMGRKLTGDGLPPLSHMPCRRKSPGARGRIPVGSQMIRHPIRDGYIGRDVPDFVPQEHEEKFMRILPDDMMAPMFSRQHSQYERAEGSLIRRERRGLSPVQRRGRLNFPPICSGSSPRSPRTRHQWSPPRRSPDGFDGHPELINCRSPKVSRPYRMESPHQHPCFNEDMIVRRRGSPPYLVRLHGDISIGPSREHDFPRQLGGLPRNIRSFRMTDPREISEDEYYEPLLHNQFGELAGDAECAVDRSCEERHERCVLGRSFRQRCSAGDDNNESFRSHADSSASQPIRFCPEGKKGFSRRDFDGHIRNRLGSPASRLRCIEQQEDDYRYDGEPGWGDGGFNDARLKKRRFERH